MKAPRRLWRVLGIVALLLGLAGTAYVFLRSASTATAAEEQAAADTADADAAESTETETDESGETEDDAGKGEDDGEDEEDGEGEDDEETRIPVSVAEVELGDVSSYVSATANLVAEDEVTVLAEAEGRLAALHVKEGDPVERGQLLAVLVQDDEQIVLDKAGLRAANAKMAFDRTSRLASQGLISEDELERITMEHRIAQQELAEAEWKLKQTEIRAPFAGRLTGRSVTVGQHVRKGDELFVVTDFDPLIARIYLPEKDIIGLEERRRVNITLQADEDVRFQGRIRQISPVVDVATGTVKITIEAVQPPPLVRPGGFVDIDIVRETHSQVALLPREAVLRELQSAHVFVATGEDMAEKRGVTLGLEDGDYIEIVSGLEAGEAVVVAGQGGLKDGAAIKVITDPTDVASDQSASADPVRG